MLIKRQTMRPKSKPRLARSLIACLKFTAMLTLSVSALTAEIVNRYSFTSDASDSVGNAHGTLMGGASIANGSVVLNGSSAYVDLPNGIIATRSNITFEAWVTDEGSGTWARIFDFGFSTGGENNPNQGTNYVFITPQSGGGVLRAAITVGGSGNEQVVEWPGSRLPIGRPAHVVFTIDAGNRIGRLYVDGQLVGENPSMTHNPTMLGYTVNNWLGRSQWVWDPYFKGSIHEFRIYDGILTPEEIAISYQLGPDICALDGPVEVYRQPTNCIVTELASATFSLYPIGRRPITIQWYRNGQPIPGATNTTLTIPIVYLTNNNDVFHARLTNVYQGVVKWAISSNAILTVLPDTNGPVLLRAISVFPTGVIVHFSEGLEPTTATNIVNYQITSTNGQLPVIAASFYETNSAILLHTAPQTEGITYTLTVSGVRDLAAARNLIIPGSTVKFIASPYMFTPIGFAITNGEFQPIPSGFEITASGEGIGNTNDQFIFLWRTVTNDFDLQIRVNLLEFGEIWTRAGLMARAGLQSNAVFAATFATPSHVGCHFQWRAYQGGFANMSGYFAPNFPYTWLRLKRSGNEFSGYASINGRTWEFLGNAVITMPEAIQVGLAVTASKPDTFITARFTELTNATGVIVTNQLLPFEPPGPSSRRTPIVITEIMYNPPGSWPDSEDLEFIEIWNSGLVTEDLTGHQLAGSISYEFPPGTKLAPGQFLVVAKNPTAAKQFYGVDCLGPYTGSLPNNGGTVRLLNELGGVLLEIEYDTTYPWPVSPDGSGHSLVLRNPSYGENDPRAWGPSSFIGGSPGRFDPYTTDPAAGVVINEFLAHTDTSAEDYIELFNTTTKTIDLSGAWLTDDPNLLKFQIPVGTILPPRSLAVFYRSTLGFGLDAAGDRIFLINSNATRVLDAVAFGGQAKGIASGRYPDGHPCIRELSTRTPGQPNSSPLIRPIVINEIMYNPISGSDDDEYIELYNRGQEPVDLSGWQIQGGVRFTFPSNTIIGPDSYLVVAKNLTNLLAKYPQLNATNLTGNYLGRLRNSSDRIILLMPEPQITTNAAGLPRTNFLYVVVNDVTYNEGGQWSIWADGWGSSLELIDPFADNSIGQNWADSDESSKAPWTQIDVTQILENGQTPSMINQGTYYGAPTRFEFFLQGPGESLVDNLEFRNNNGPNLLANGTFESGTNSWSWGGVLRNSYVQDGVGLNGSKALHMVSVARGDTGPNKVWTRLTGTVVTNAPNTGTVRAAVRWLRGSPYIVFRLQGNWMEASYKLNVPNNCGTPGLPNSRRIPNAGPTITEVKHLPILPNPGQRVLVTARVSDPDGVGGVYLRYRIDPSTSYYEVRMSDDGITGGDEVANDGIYTGIIPGCASNTLAAFYIYAIDTRNATNAFPATAPARECLVRWGETSKPGSLGTYRLWLTSSNINFWTQREKNANDPIDATFVYNNCRVVYNVGTMYSGSPFHTPTYDGPLGFACDYEVNFPPDEKFLGAEAFVLNAYDVTTGHFFHNDRTTQIDLTANWIARKLGQPYNYRRHVHVVVNGLTRGTIYDDVQQPNSDTIKEFFPNDENGQLRKIEDWFEFEDTATSHGITTATIERFNKATGEIDTKRYRWNWRPRVTRNPDDWAPFTNFIAAVNATNAPNYLDLVRTWIDLPNFLRPIVVNHICGNWDSYGYSRGKNMYAYKPDNKPWRLWVWDMELALGSSSSSPTDSIYSIHDPRLAWMINSIPEIHREYLQGFDEALRTVLKPEVYEPILDERYQNLVLNGIPVQPPTSIKNFLVTRTAYLTNVLPKAMFTISSPTNITLQTSNVLVLNGTAPLQVSFISVNGVLYKPTWTSVTNWQVIIPVSKTNNVLEIAASDRYSNQIPDTTVTITLTNNFEEPDPAGWVVFNEIMYAPPRLGAGFIEIYNAHTNIAFDLTGWRIEELQYVFPTGTVLLPQNYLVLAENPFVFNETYGIYRVPFDTLPTPIPPRGAVLTLSRPVPNTTNFVVVDRIKYEAAPPWPMPTNAASLQLIDAYQDNSRVANWILLTNIPTPPSTNILLLDHSSTWKYMQVSNLDNVAWQSPNYDDSKWPSGQGLLAYENNPAITPLIKTTLLDPRIATNGMPSGHAYYFRTYVVITNSLKYYAVNVSAYIDDGAVFYVNGTEVARIRMNPGPVSNSTLASGIPPNGDATSPDTFTIPGNVFVTGTNVIAVSVHQNAANSSDIVFGMRMEAVLTNVLQSAPYPCTPGWENSLVDTLPPFPPIWLNEVQPENITGPADNYNERDPWVEIINLGGSPVTLGGLYLSDTTTNLTKWAFPSNATIPANGFLVIWCDGQINQTTTNHLHTSFRITPTSGIVILSRVINNSTQVLDYVSYNNVPANWSHGSIPDGQPFYRRNLYYATAGASNNPASPPIQVFINEWMADNTRTLADPVDGNFEDWFELWNAGSEAVDLGGYYLTDTLDNPFKFRIPETGQYVIPPGGFLLVWADGESNQNSTNNPQLHVNFALSKAGEAIGLFTPEGTPVDVVVFGPQITDVSQGRFPDGGANIYFMPPTPLAPNALSNSAPVIAPVSNRVAILGQTITIQLVATDTDIPPQTLTFSLGPEAPEGMTINPTTGLIIWTPNNAPSTNIVSVIVTDNGTPPLSSSTTFTIIVVSPPTIHASANDPTSILLQWNSYPGQKFVIETTSDLTSKNWQPVTPIISGTGEPIAYILAIEPNLPTSFYRVRVLDQ